MNAKLERIASEMPRIINSTDTVSSLRCLKDGHDSLCFTLNLDQQAYFVKVSLHRQRLQKVTNACLASLWACEAGVHTQFPVAYFSMIEPDKPVVLVSTFIDGEDALDQFGTLSADKQSDFMFDFGASIGRVHSIKKTGFSEELQHPPSAALTEVVDKRVSYCLSQADAFVNIDRVLVERACRKISRFAEELASDVQPSLVHGDVGLRNALIEGDRYAGIIDFEHAKIHDPVYDFVKLDFTFGRDSTEFNSFLKGYHSDAPVLTQFDKRLELFEGLELLSGIPYWHRTGESELLAQYTERFLEWLSRS